MPKVYVLDGLKILRPFKINSIAEGTMLGLLIMSLALSIGIGANIAGTFHFENTTPEMKITIPTFVIFASLFLYAINVQLLYANCYWMPIVSLIAGCISGIVFHRHLLKEKTNGQVW